MPSAQLLSALGEALGSGPLVRELLRGNNTYSIIDFGVSPGAVGPDGREKDQTDAIKQGVAQIVARANGAPATVIVPPGVYMVQDPTDVQGAAELPSDGCFWIGPTARNITFLGYGAILKIGPKGTDTFAIRCFGSQCVIAGFAIDCNASEANPAKQNSGLEINGSTSALIGSVNGVDGCDNIVEHVRVYNGVKDEADINQGEECFASTAAQRTLFSRCYALDTAWIGFRVAVGDGVMIRDCYALNVRSYALRHQGQTEDLYIDGFKATSTKNCGRPLLLVDPNASGANRCKRAYLTNLDLYCNPTVDNGDGSGVTLKVAGCNEVHISNSRVACGTGLSNRSFRIEDSLAKVVVDNVSFEGPLVFTIAASSGSSVFQGQPSGQADNGGSVQFTLGSGHGLIAGKSLFVSGSDIASYNREHVVVSVDATTVTTDIAYTAGSLGSNIWAHSAVDQISFTDCKFSHPLTAGGTYHFHTCYARVLNFERCKFEALTATANLLAVIDWRGASDLGLSLMRFVDCEAVFNSSTYVKVIRPASQTAMIITSGKTIGLRSTIKNLGSGTALWMDTRVANNATEDYPAKAFLFRSDGDRTGAYLATASPSSLTDGTTLFADGDVFRNTSPASGGAPGWVCTTPGTCSGGGAGVFSAQANLA